MKKSLLMIAALAATMTVAAQEQGSVTMSVTPTAEQNYLFYASPNDVEGEGNLEQKIVTGADYVWGSPTYRMQHFLVECLAAPGDFQKGVTSGVTPLNNASLVPNIPARAKISGLALPGWRHSLSTANDLVYNLNAFLYFKNMTANEATAGTLPYKNTMYAAYKRILDDAGNGYIPVIAEANKQMCAIPEPTADNPHCVDLTFDAPFEYTGDYLNVAIDLIPTDDNGVESAAANSYGAVFDFQQTKATEELATVYHTIRRGGTLETEFTFYKGCEADIYAMIASNPYMAMMGLTQEKVGALLDYFNFQDHTLPAFQLTYYTNDIRGQVLDQDGRPVVDAADELQPNGRPLISLYDETAQDYITPDGVDALNGINAAEVAADGTFSFTNLDHTHSYVMMASSANCGSKEMRLNFDQGAVEDALNLDAANAINNDLVCNITMNVGQTTGVSQLDSRAAVVGVTYYNVAGQTSSTPFAGVNMMVTRYSDGTVKTTKVVR